jgi:hypothetical protein
MPSFIRLSAIVIHPSTERAWFWSLLALAVVLRTLNFDPYAMHHPDEVLQYLEPAYRLLTGDAIVTIDFRIGMRGWLLPWLLAGPMGLGQWMGGTAFGGIVTARIAAALVGLIPVVAAWHLGRRLSPAHGILAMAVMAVWYEQIVFSTHVLTESLSTSLFLGAAALVGKDEGRTRVIAGGALLALAVVIRFHYAIAGGLFAILALANDWKRWRWLAAGVAPIILLSGTVDLVMGQWPFEWIWNNVHYNLVEGKSAQFRVHWPSFFLSAIWGQWGWLAPLFAILAIESGKPFRPLLYAAVVNLAAHSLIAHKEYRFIEFTCATIILLAAIGSVNAIRWIERKLGPPLPVTATLAGLVLSWGAASAWLGRDRPLDQWFGKESLGPELVHRAGRDPKVCGLGAPKIEYAQLSRAYLGRPMPIVLLDHTPWPRKLLPAGAELQSVNAVMAPTGSEAVLPNFTAVHCKGEEPWRRCLYVRPGPCRPTPEAASREIQKTLGEMDR